MASFKKIVMIGASGNLGAIILKALLESKAFEVTILTRSSSTSTFPAGVKVIKTEYNESDLAKAFDGQDAIVSAVGAMGFQEQKVMIEAAIKAGVKRFIPSEYSTNTLSKAVCELVPVFAPKKMILDYLKEKESAGLTWTGLGTGLLFDWGMQTGFLGFDLAGKTATIWDGGKKAFSITNQNVVGEAVVEILKHPAETANRYLYVQTVSTTQEEILAALEQNSGQKWEVKNVKTDEQIATGRQLISQSDFAGMFMLVQASSWGNVEGSRTNFAVDEELANGLLGVPEGSVDGTIKAVLGG